MNFWYDLSQSGDLTPQYSNDWATYGLKAGVTMPATKLNPNVGLVAIISADPRLTTQRNQYMPMGNNTGSIFYDGNGWPNGGIGNNIRANPFNCLTVEEIDVKMDDGMPNTGNVLNLSTSATYGSPPGGGVGGSGDCESFSQAPTAKYGLNADNASNMTSLSIAIMSQTGNNN